VVGSSQPVDERADGRAGRHHHIPKLVGALERRVVAGDRDDRDGGHSQQRGGTGTHLLQRARHTS